MSYIRFVYNIRTRSCNGSVVVPTLTFTQNCPVLIVNSHLILDHFFFAIVAHDTMIRRASLS